MARGGARNRSGPSKDPNSGASMRSGFTLRNLDPNGHTGMAPEWPLLGISERELEIWCTLWTYPQAIAWANEPHRWFTIAMYARTLATTEMPSITASAATVGNLHRFADQIGLTPAGLKENGWKLGEPEVAADPDAEEAEGEADVINLFGNIADGG